MADSGLRSRRTVPTKSIADLTPTSSDSEPDEPQLISTDPLTQTRISVLDILRVLAGLLLLNCTLSYFITNDSIFWGRRPQFTRLSWLEAKWRGEILLTDAELSLYNGTDPSLPIYLALNGTIYDVSAGPQHYGPGGSYRFFSGRDATRAFVTGCFDEDLTGDLRGVEEMFMPIDLDEPPTFEEGVDEEEKKRKRGVWKSKREQAKRKAKARVKEVVEQWRETYDKGKGGKYFRVGRVNRPNGFEGEPKKVLCNKAKLSRPKTST